MRDKAQVLSAVRAARAWRIGEAGIPKSKKGPWDQPCGEALIDWPRFSKWLLKPRGKRKS